MRRTTYAPRAQTRICAELHLLLQIHTVLHVQHQNAGSPKSPDPAKLEQSDHFSFSLEDSTISISEQNTFHMNVGSVVISSVNSLAQGQIKGYKELKTRNESTQHIYANQQLFIDVFALQKRVVWSYGPRTRGASISSGQRVRGDPWRPPDGGTSTRHSF